MLMQWAFVVINLYVWFYHVVFVYLRNPCLFSIFMVSLYGNVFTYYTPKSPEKEMYYGFW